MDLVAIESPATGVATARETPELFDAAVRIVAASQPFEIVTDQLIETLAQGPSSLARLRDDLLIDR
ncbi:MAG: hypothetical protein WAU58_17970 [Terriglobales bacterium]